MRRKVLHFVTCCLGVACLALGGCAKEEPVAEVPAAEMPEPDYAEAPVETEAPVEDDLNEFIAKLTAMSDEELEELFEDAAENDTLTPDEWGALMVEIDTRYALSANDNDDDSEPHGIITLIGTYGGWDHPRETFDIVSINPENGKIKSLYTFSVPLYRVEAGDETVAYLLADTTNLFGNYRDMFSLNFDKLAITTSYDSGETHAGWIDSAGNFVDVTAALLPADRGDFAEQPHYIALRFDNGHLAYNHWENEKLFQSKVPESDLSANAVTEYTAPKIAWSVGGHTVRITDWIDNTNYLVTYYSMERAFCEICNNETKRLSSFLPETSRCNWSGVLSPDGTTVAFLSSPNSLSGDAEIFTVPVTGGDPIKLNLEFTLQSRYGDISIEHHHGVNADVYCYLLDWLE